MKVSQAAGSPLSKPGSNQSLARLGRAVGPRLLVAVAERVVAHGRGRAEALLDVAGLDEAAVLGGVAPDARVAVGLELEPDRQVVGAARVRLLRLLRPRRWCPSRFCTWWPSSWASTYTGRSRPGAP